MRVVRDEGGRKGVLGSVPYGIIRRASLIISARPPVFGEMKK